jgi:hypothetical protein
MHQLVFRREEQEDRRIALERRAYPLSQAIDREVKIAGDASRVLASLAFGRQSG